MKALRHRKRDQSPQPDYGPGGSHSTRYPALPWGTTFGGLAPRSKAGLKHQRESRKERRKPAVMGGSFLPAVAGDMLRGRFQCVLVMFMCFVNRISAVRVLGLVKSDQLGRIYGEYIPLETPALSR